MVTNEVFQKWCTTIATDTDTVLLNEDKNNNRNQTHHQKIKKQEIFFPIH